jgi:hypothetical protein
MYNLINTIIASVITFTSIYILSYFIFPNKKVRANIISSIHASYLTYFALSIFFNKNYADVGDTFVIGFSIGYFIFDLPLWLIYIGDTFTTNLTTIIHHSISIYLLSSCYLACQYIEHIYLAPFLLLTEISTPFINMHHIYKVYNINGFLNKLNKIIIFIIFTIVRIVMFTSIIIYSYIYEVIDSKVVIATILLLLNIYWYLKLVKNTGKKQKN